MRLFSPRRRFAATACLALTALLPLTLLGCSGGGGTPSGLGIGSAIPDGPLRAIDFFPLKEGNEMAVTGASGWIDTTKVIRKTFEGQQAFGLKRGSLIAPGNGGSSYVSYHIPYYVVEGSDVKAIGSEDFDGDAEGETYKGKEVNVSALSFGKYFKLSVGESVSEVLTYDRWGANADIKTGTFSENIKITRIPNEMVDLPFGKFECVGFRTENRSDGSSFVGKSDVFFAPGLGIVKDRQTNDPEDIDLLTGARINGKTYGTVPSAPTRIKGK